jgi:CheY-like chemotaxis protein
MRPDAFAELPRRRILIVDDNADAANGLGKLLSVVFGQDVRVMYDGPSALALAGSFRPDIVLLDLGMAVMDGYEVAMRLRERADCSGTLIVAVTGWGQEEDRLRSREVGIDLHLVKPVSGDTVRGLLARLDDASACGPPGTARFASRRPSPSEHDLGRPHHAEPDQAVRTGHGL